MLVWISGGGTAGHVYPGLTVRDALMAAPRDAVTAVEWVGTSGGMERSLAMAAGSPFLAVDAAPLVGVSPWRLARNMARLGRGVAQALRHMKRRRPAVVLITGGYVSVPVAIAARLARVPLAVFLPDVVPGRAVRLTARLAALVMTTRHEALPHLPGRSTVVTGYPIRAAVRSCTRDAARRHWAIPAPDAAIIVFGGSQGARVLNEAVAAAAPEILRCAWLIHVTGRRELASVMARKAALPLPDDAARRWLIEGYLDGHDMAAALAAADLAVSRAGAAILGEYPAQGLPAVLVPLELAGGHQHDNATVLTAAGAAVVLRQDALSGPTLARLVLDLLADQPRRERMSAAARRLDRPDAAGDIAQHLIDLAGAA